MNTVIEPRGPGSLIHNTDSGVSHCPTCNWRGVPTIAGGEPQNACPSCEAELLDGPRRVEATPGRNDPCPCGSGKKFKKCHGR